MIKKYISKSGLNRYSSYHTYRECPKLNSPRSNQDSIIELTPDESFVDLKKCSWCKQRSEKTSPEVVLNTLSALNRYKLGVVQSTPSGFTISVKSQPTLHISHEGSWRFESNDPD
jgi:hypothetical protein